MAWRRGRCRSGPSVRRCGEGPEGSPPAEPVAFSAYQFGDDALGIHRRTARGDRHGLFSSSYFKLCEAEIYDRRRFAASTRPIRPAKAAPVGSGTATAAAVVDAVNRARQFARSVASTELLPLESP